MHSYNDDAVLPASFFDLRSMLRFDVICVIKLFLIFEPAFYLSCKKHLGYGLAPYRGGVDRQVGAG